MPYVTEIIETGHYEEKEEVLAIYMPRDTWGGIVEELLDDGLRYEVIREEMIETASKMPRYPLGTWMDDDRGCGCVVGEFLVARDIVKRIRGESDNDTVFDALKTMGDRGEILSSFGNDIDVQLRRNLLRHGAPSTSSYGGRDTVVVFI